MALTPHEQSVVRYYDSVTGDRSWQTWDDDHLHFGLFDPARLPVYEADPHAIEADKAAAVRAMTVRIVTPANLRPGMRVVDAGCGVGGTALWMAAQGARVTGVNFNDQQLTEARAKAESRGLSEQCAFVWGNCSEHLPFDDASVDVVVNIESSCHYRDRSRFYDEVARILKPGGILAAQDWMAKDDPTKTERKDLEDICHAWYLPSLESPRGSRAGWQSRGFAWEGEWMGDAIRPNGLLADFYWRRFRSLPDFMLSERQVEHNGHVRTIAKTVLSGSMGVLIYKAVKPA